MIILSIVAHNLSLEKPLLTTLSAIITIAISIVLTYKISKPLNPFRTLVILAIIVISVLALLLPLTRTFFEFI